MCRTNADKLLAELESMPDNMGVDIALMRTMASGYLELAEPGQADTIEVSVTPYPDEIEGADFATPGEQVYVFEVHLEDDGWYEELVRTLSAVEPSGLTDKRPFSVDTASDDYRDRLTLVELLVHLTDLGVVPSAS